MPPDKNHPENSRLVSSDGITKIRIRGYKSLLEEQSIEIRPLTILAGANSSGKSSIMQPLLLMKQTLEASFDPGALLLDGPNLRFTSADQLLSRQAKGKGARTFSVGIEAQNDNILETDFTKETNKVLTVSRTKYSSKTDQLVLTAQSTSDDIEKQMPKDLKKYGFKNAKWAVTRVRCFLKSALLDSNREDYPVLYNFIPHRSRDIEWHIPEIIHLPGLRGNPLRTYPVSAVGSTFPGTFERYVASIIAHWQIQKDVKILEKLSADLKLLGLTWKVTAKPINETQVELQVGRLPQAARGGAKDWVNITDVGFGVSQTLPVLVALLVARPGQMVFIEQPEIHLHPRAQTALAQVLVDAAKSGVRVVVETHSELLLLGIKTLVAEQQLPPEGVKLHWFQRSEDGITHVTSGDLDKAGTFGDWPEDFADVTLNAQSRFLSAPDAVTETE